MLRPDITRPLTIAWGGFIAAVLIAWLLWSWFADDGGMADRLASSHATYLEREGGSAVLLSREVELQRQANRDLGANVERIKQQVGIQPINPFIVPDSYRDLRRFYFQKIHDETKRTLYDRAVQRLIGSYAAELGYGRMPADDDAVRQELVRLQLIAKAVSLALSTEEDLASIDIEHGPIEVTGPPGRPPLLIEYRFSLQVRGSLKDILWLVHQLGVEQPEPEIYRGLNTLFTAIQRRTEVQVKPLVEEDFFPLIVRGLTISSANVSHLDSITQLDATIELAGMEFLDQVRRQELAAEVTLPRGRSRPAGRRVR